MKKQILTLLFVSIGSFALSQDLYPGYIISSKGDTTIGQVQFTALFRTKSDIKFFVKGKKVESKIDSLLGYGFIESDKYHHFHKIKTHGMLGTFIFLERVLSGRFSVFVISVLKDFNIISNKPEDKLLYYKENQYYLKNEKGNVYYINFRDFIDDRKKVIKELVANCPKMDSLISKKMNQDKFFRLIIAYNENCTINN